MNDERQSIMLGFDSSIAGRESYTYSVIIGLWLLFHRDFPIPTKIDGENLILLRRAHKLYYDVVHT